MHCPRCGTAASVAQQFCRSCGMNLEKVAELVGESVVAETPGGELTRLKDLQRKHESLGGIAGLIALGLALAAGVMGYFLVSAKSLKEKLAANQIAAGPLIDSPRLPAGSVTEQTTQLLTEQSDRSTHEIAS